MMDTTYVYAMNEWFSLLQEQNLSKLEEFIQDNFAESYQSTMIVMNSPTVFLTRGDLAERYRAFWDQGVVFTEPVLLAQVGNILEYHYTMTWPSGTSYRLRNILYFSNENLVLMSNHSPFDIQVVAFKNWDAVPHAVELKADIPNCTSECTLS